MLLTVVTAQCVLNGKTRIMYCVFKITALNDQKTDCLVGITHIRTCNINMFDNRILSLRYS